MQCKRCGVELSEAAAFCPSCGSSTSAETESQGQQGGLQSNVAGLLCYFVGFLTGIFFLVAEPYKNDRFVRFHALQSIFLSVAWFAVYFALGVLTAALPGMFWRLTWMLHSLIGFVFFLVWVFLMYKAYNNEQFKLPIIGDLAAKQA